MIFNSAEIVTSPGFPVHIYDGNIETRVLFFRGTGACRVELYVRSAIEKGSFPSYSNRVKGM